VRWKTERVLADDLARKLGAENVNTSITTEGGDIRKISDVEADMVRKALHQSRGNISSAAVMLGIGRTTLYRKMEELGL
jgi:transcriptional regulator of acetoin/glycerol metabolism